MAQQKEEGRVQLHFGGAVIDVKESSAERYLVQGATKYNAKQAKADAKAAEDKREAALTRRAGRNVPEVVTPDPDTTPEPVDDTVKAEPAVQEAAVTTDDAPTTPKEA